MSKIFHLTGIYLDERDQRANEICDALEMNLANSALTEVHLRVEENPDQFFAAMKDQKRSCDERMAKILESPKAVVTVLGRCSRYQDFFDYAAERLEGEIIALTNADIGLTESIAAVHDVDFSDSFLCVSRKDYVWRPATCQDLWIFRAPLRCRADWAFGYPGSEVKLAYEVAKAGYRTCNPSALIKVRHFHWSQKRRYRIPEDVIPGPHKETTPSDLRPVLKRRPKGTRAIVTTIDPSLEEVNRVVTPYRLSYANRIGADLVEIPDGPGKQMLGVFDNYERVIYMEPDVLVHPEAPNLFDVIKEGEFGVLNESYYTDVNFLVDAPWTETYRKYSYADDALAQHPHWNTNIMVADLWSAFLFDHPSGSFDRRMGYVALHGGDYPGTIHRAEMYLSVAARHFNLPVKEYHISLGYLPNRCKERPKPKPLLINLKWVPREHKAEAAIKEIESWKR